MYGHCLVPLNETTMFLGGGWNNRWVLCTYREHEMAFSEFTNLHHTIDVHFAFSDAYLLDTDTRTWSEPLAMLGEHAAAACGVVNVSDTGGKK